MGGEAGRESGRVGGVRGVGRVVAPIVNVKSGDVSGGGGAPIAVVGEGRVDIRRIPLIESSWDGGC